MAIYLISKYANLFPSATCYLLLAQLHAFPNHAMRIDRLNSTQLSSRNKRLTYCRAADPIFAMAIGSSAAYIRIRREHQAQHPERAGEIGYKEIVSTGAGRIRRWWAGDFAGL